MTVYALYSNYFDGCDFWNNLIDLYISQELAEEAQFKLEVANKDIERQSYYIQGLPVIEK